MLGLCNRCARARGVRHRMIGVWGRRVKALDIFVKIFHRVRCFPTTFYAIIYSFISLLSTLSVIYSLISYYLITTLLLSSSYLKYIHLCYMLIDHSERVLVSKEFEGHLREAFIVYTYVTYISHLCYLIHLCVRYSLFIDPIFCFIF